MDEAVKTCERGGKVFIFPKPPQGHIVDPTDIVINEEGVWIPIWHPVDPSYSQMRRDFLLVLLLESAIRLCQHTFSSYKSEFADLEEIVNAVFLAHQAYLSNMDLDLQSAHDLVSAFDRLLGVRLPEKRETRDQIGRSVSTVDSRGRRNPSAKAARLVAALFRIQSVRKVNIRIIVAQIFARQGALKMVLEENLLVLKAIEEMIASILSNPSFKRTDFTSSLTYNRTIAELKKMAIDTARLWGAPYADIGLFISEKLENARGHLESHHHLKAMAQLREVRDGFSQIRFLSRQVESKLRAFDKSSWQSQPKHAIMALQNIEEIILSAPSYLEKWVLVMEYTLANVIVDINREQSNNAQSHLDCALRRVVISMPDSPVKRAFELSFFFNLVRTPEFARSIL